MIVIRNVSFGGDAITIDYMDSDKDVRSQGNSFLASSITFNPDHDAFREAAVDTLKTLEELLLLVLGGHYGSPPASQEPPEEEDDDDDD